MRDPHREAEAQGRGRSRLHAGSLMWDSIPGLQGHSLGQRQALNHWATRAAPEETLLMKIWDKGHLGGSVVECLPLVQGVIPGSRDRVPHRAPRREPASLVPMSLPLSLSIMKKINKIFKKKKKKGFSPYPSKLYSVIPLTIGGIRIFCQVA